MASMQFGNLPVWVHTFSPMGLKDIRAVDQLSKKYPSVPAILGHLGGATGWIP